MLEDHICGLGLNLHKIKLAVFSSGWKNTVVCWSIDRLKLWLTYEVGGLRHITSWRIAWSQIIFTKPKRLRLLFLVKLDNIPCHLNEQGNSKNRQTDLNECDALLFWSINSKASINCVRLKQGIGRHLRGHRLLLVLGVQNELEGLEHLHIPICFVFLCYCEFPLSEILGWSGSMFR